MLLQSDRHYNHYNVIKITKIKGDTSKNQGNG